MGFQKHDNNLITIYYYRSIYVKVNNKPQNHKSIADTIFLSLKNDF